MAQTKYTLVLLSITVYLLILVNVILFVTFTILGSNRGLVFNTLGTKTTISQIVVYTTWTVVYIYQFISIIFTIVFVANQKPGDPVLITPVTLGLYILAQLLQIVINTVFLTEVSFSFLAAVAVVLTVLLILSYKSLYQNRFLVADLNLTHEDSLIRGFFQNTVDLYLTWAAISAVLNFGVILVNRANPPTDPSIACAIVLVLIIVLNVLYVITDLTIFDKFSRYTLSPYFLRLWIIGSLIQGTTSLGLLIVEILILVFTVAALIGKFVLMGVRRMSKPLVPRLT